MVGRRPRRLFVVTGVRRAGARGPATAEGTNAGAYTALDWGLMAAAATMFGSSFLFMAEALEAFEPALVTLVRVGVGFLLLTLFPASRAPVDRDAWPRLVLLGVFWFAAPLSLFPLAQQHIDSSLAGMINGSTPLFVTVIAAVLLRRLPGPAQVLGLLVGLVGIVLIALPGLDEGSTVLGIVLVLAAVSCYGIAFNLAVPVQQRYGSLAVLWRSAAIGLVLVAPLGLDAVRTSTWQTSSALAGLAVGVFGTGLGYVAVTTLTGRVGSVRASVVTYVATPVSVVLGVVLRDEPLAAVSAVGVVVALSGALLASRADVRRAGR